MRILDQILQECSNRELTGIDDIEKLQVTGHGLKLLFSEYCEEFEEDVTNIADLQDFIGMKIEVTPYIENGQGKEYKIFEPVF